MYAYASSSPSRPLPKRHDSLAKVSRTSSPTSAPFPKETDKLFTAIVEEVKDAKRVHEQGQEEDLRYALDKMMARVTELATMLQAAYRAQAETETSLSLTRSNLQLVTANNEMLEEALSRSSARDVGWRRWSAKENSIRTKDTIREEDARPHSVDMGSLNGSDSTSPRSMPGTLQVDNHLNTNASPMTSPQPSSAEAPGFFRRITGSKTPGNVTPARSSSPSRTPTFAVHVMTATSSLASASMPSLVPPLNDGPQPNSPALSSRAQQDLQELEKVRKELDSQRVAQTRLEQQRKQLEAQLAAQGKLLATQRVQLEEQLSAQKSQFAAHQAELTKEREEREMFRKDKAALEAELENLSQALFEEANKMVAQERMKLAAIQGELRDTRSEKEALKAALRIVESEKEQFRTATSTPEPRISLEERTNKSLDLSPQKPAPEPLRISPRTSAKRVEPIGDALSSSPSTSRSDSKPPETLRYATPGEGSETDEEEVRHVVHPSPSSSPPPSQSPSRNSTQSLNTPSPATDEQDNQIILAPPSRYDFEPSPWADVPHTARP